MPSIEYARTSDGVEIGYSSVGEGFPLVWAHEFAGNADSWAAQVGYFARRYRVITYNARGYPPSEVAQDPEVYSQDRAVEDLHDLLQHLEIDEAYVGGLSMGGATAIHFGLRYPEMTRALIVAGAGTGSADPEQFAKQCDSLAERLEDGGMRGLADYVRGPMRTQLLRKDPVAWALFAEQFFAHSSSGSAHTLRGVQGGRRPIFAFERELRDLDVPTLILVGDEDDPCLEPAIFLKRMIARSGLVTFPQSGHTINLEEPDLFNRVVMDFLHAVEAGRWLGRDAGSGGGFLT